MSKTIAIVGATGGQGGSLVKALLNSNLDYKIRGLTRNVNSEAAKALAAKGVEVITTDLNDEASLVKAFHGAHAIFAVTDFFEPFSSSGPDQAMKIEYQQGVNLANAALKTKTLEHYIWSTLPDNLKISNGKHRVPHFEAKVRIDQFIKSQPALLAKTSFLWVTFYETNLFFPIFSPTYLKPAGVYAWLLPSSASTIIASVGNHFTNVGIFARGILANPSITQNGQYIFANVETLTSEEYLAAWAKTTGKKARFVQISDKDYWEMYPAWGEEMGRMMKFWEDAGEKSWSGETLIGAEELGIKGELVSTEQAFQAMDWSDF